MPIASPTVPFSKPNLLLLDGAVEALLWTMPEAEFSIVIAPQGARATVTDADGKDHFADVRHPELVARAVREAMLKAFQVQPAPHSVYDGHFDSDRISRALVQAWTWLPDHTLSVGLNSQEVWARVQATTEDRAASEVRLYCDMFNLSDALIAAAALRVYGNNNRSARM